MQFNLEFNIQSYWHIGTGLEGGAYADALTLKDEQQLPYLPGKSIKGLLRDAFKKAIDNNWFSEQVTTNDNNSFELIELLFGKENTAGTSKQGLLQISSACLSATEINFLTDNKQAKSMLYKVTYATAIDETSGVAKDTSLRSMEVTIPMTLNASLNINSAHPSYKAFSTGLKEQFYEQLNLVLPFISEIGAKRHRGLGKTIVTASQNITVNATENKITGEQ